MRKLISFCPFAFYTFVLYIVTIPFTRCLECEIGKLTDCGENQFCAQKVHGNSTYGECVCQPGFRFNKTNICIPLSQKNVQEQQDSNVYDGSSDRKSSGVLVTCFYVSVATIIIAIGLSFLYKKYVRQRFSRDNIDHHLLESTGTNADLDDDPIA